MIVLSYLPSYTLAHHDVCVAIAKDGEVLYTFEEQKLSRAHPRESKYLPDRALLSALYTSGIHPGDIDAVTVVGPEEIFDPQSVLGRIEKYFGVKVRQTIACPHHFAHTALATLGSPFDDAVFWTLDAVGEDMTCGEFGTYKDRQATTLLALKEQSLAIFYHLMTGCCGFGDFEEGKVMGLAGYGEIDETLYANMRSLFSFEDTGHVRFTGSRTYQYPHIHWDKFSHDEFRPYKVIQYLRRDLCPELDEMTRHQLPETIAATGQRLVEDLAVESLRRMAEKFSIKIDRLCLSGGFFMNIVVNKAIRDAFGCEIFVPPGTNDMGLAAGAALWTCQNFGDKKVAAEVAKGKSISAYMGPSFENQEIESLIERFPLSTKRVCEAEMVKSAAQAIVDGRVVGWFQGRAEFGARALGARSVLADPRNPDSKSRINQLLKKRDWFMPYAPAIMEEYAGEYLKVPCHSPYMTLAFDSVEGAVEKVPSAIHVDGSVRPQVVRRDDNPLFHDMIGEFHRLTGVGMVLNTSFNRHGVPIVATPRHAIEHLLEGVVDVLFLGGYEVTIESRRHEQQARLVPEPILQSILGIKHAYDFLVAGDSATAEGLFDKTGRSVTWSNGDGSFHLVIDGCAFDMASATWDDIAANLADAPGSAHA